MSTSFRTVSQVVWLVACAHAAFAQDPAEPPYSLKQVPALLESGDPREQACGAWLAGRFFLTESVPLLERAVETRLNSSQGFDPALDIALDALIQLNAQLTPALLERVYQRRAAQTLVLLSKIGGDGQAALLSILNTASGETWFAAANLLRAHNTGGVAALVLRDVVLTARVGSWGVGGGGAVACGCGAVGQMPGYPPWPTYVLSSFAAPGHIVLAPGPRTIYYDRRVARAGVTPNPNACTQSGPSAADRLAFFAQIAPQMRAEKSCEIAAVDGPAVDIEIRSCVSGLRAEYRSFLNALARYNLLTPDEAATLSRVRIRVERLDR